MVQSERAAAATTTAAAVRQPTARETGVSVRLVRARLLSQRDLSQPTLFSRHDGTGQHDDGIESGTTPDRQTDRETALAG